ncbi:hypothetical protein KI387_037718 [Taxus chinensis]|uniref:Plastid lipid-associated protein/fibrillin conserved domain-containing protein n=1 Tax=Taxus chinensis TaxID=29808 RepID=A0AA38FSW2_TAXCH|nr:hypothetical protein KI387_037718 [Taxus chinensis]
MALLSAKSFFLLHNSNHPTLFSLPRSLPTSSFQYHANSITLPTVSSSILSQKCTSLSSSNRTSSMILFALPGDDDYIPPSNQRGDATPPINDGNWGSETKRTPNLNDDEWGDDPKSMNTDPQDGEYSSPSENVGAEEKAAAAEALYVDEWGDKADPDELSAQTTLSDVDPPSMSDDDEWGGTGTDQIPDTTPSTSVSSKLVELKQCLVDSFYGTEYGLRVSSQARAEIVELISQLEAQNPTPAPTEALTLLQGNWILVYTSFSELLPLIAAGTLPFVKLGKICQSINTGTFTVENSASYIAPFASFSVRALASFEVRSPKRIEVKFEEGIIPPPEITSTLDIPENIEIFGQKINLNSFQGSLYPFQEAARRISQVISGQSPIKIPIRRGGAQSWLLTTYLDEDLRISRGDGGGLFVLIKEGSSFLNL